MKIIIDTKAQRITEQWTKADRQTSFEDLQISKLETMSSALAEQIALLYGTNQNRAKVLTTLCVSMAETISMFSERP